MLDSRMHGVAHVVWPDSAPPKTPALPDERRAELAAANEQLRLEIERRKQVETIWAGEKRVLELIATGTSVREVLTALCHALEEHSAGIRCAIRIAPEGEARAADAAIFGAATLAGLPAPFEDRRRIIAEIDAQPAVRAWARRRGVRTLWIEPVVGSTGQSLGEVVTAYLEARSPTERELEAGMAEVRLAGIILEKARADGQARKRLAELAHVGRLATMGEMASGLAHELNQPLCAIVNYMEACIELSDSKTANPELRQAMSEAARQAERAGEVIRRLRDFVKHREPQRTAVGVNQAIHEVVGLTSTELRQHEIKVRLQLGKRLPPVLADAIQVQQVIVNLVRNAIDAMGDVAPAQRRLRIASTRRGPFVEVAVQDSGGGISPELQEQVFDSFFTTKSQGMGMGLSISRSIIELHEGRIWVTPNAKCGVTFHFTLPAARRMHHDDAERDRVRGR